MFFKHALIKMLQIFSFLFPRFLFFDSVKNYLFFLYYNYLEKFSIYKRKTLDNWITNVFT